MGNFVAGRYRGRMLSVSLGASEKKGTPEIRFNFEPTGHYGANGLEPCSPEPRTIFKYITDGTIDYLIQDLAALGYDRESFAEIDSDHPDAFAWAGIEFDTKLGFEEYEGKQKERWEFARGVSKGKPMDSKDVRGLDAKYGAYLKAGNRPAPRQTAPAGAAAPPANEDVPF